MAEKLQETHPMATAAAAKGADVESAAATTVPSDELRRKKRIKCFAYIAALAVFQAVVILVLALTIFKIKTPKYRLGSVSFQELNTSTSSATSPSFTMKFSAEVHVKNTNFGHYKFENSTITFAYMGTPVGEATVTKARARARSTKKMNVTVDVGSNNFLPNSNLRSDIDSGFLNLTSYSKLSGKVHLIKMIKKKKSAEMNCTMTINLGSKAVQDLKCK